MYGYYSNPLEDFFEMIFGAFGSQIITTVVASVLSSIVVTYCIRWFIFQKAGEKGWKALIPFYSDYVYYKIAWSGRIYLSLLVVQVGCSLIGLIFGLINVYIGIVFGVILNTAVMAAQAVCKWILQFKMSHCFGRSDYYAVGLYFFNSIFSTILAFGDAKYVGAQKDGTADGIGVPKFIDDIFDKLTSKAQPQQSYQYNNQYNQQPQRPQQPQGGYQNNGYAQQPQQPYQNNGYATPRRTQHTQPQQGMNPYHNYQQPAAPVQQTAPVQPVTPVQPTAPVQPVAPVQQPQQVDPNGTIRYDQ